MQPALPAFQSLYNTFPCNLLLHGSQPLPNKTSACPFNLPIVAAVPSTLTFARVSDHQPLTQAAARHGRAQDPLLLPCYHAFCPNQMLKHVYKQHQRPNKPPTRKLKITSCNVHRPLVRPCSQSSQTIWSVANVQDSTKLVNGNTPHQQPTSCLPSQHYIVIQECIACTEPELHNHPAPDLHA